MNDVVWIVERNSLSESTRWNLTYSKHNIEICDSTSYYDEIAGYMKQYKTELILPYGSFKFLNAFKTAFVRFKTNVSIGLETCSLEKFRYLNYVEKLKEACLEKMLLNYPYTYTTFDQLRKTPAELFNFLETNYIFAKSDSGEKFLIGNLYNKEFFPDVINSTFYYQRNNRDFCPTAEMVIASTKKNIMAEYRCFVVGGKIVSSSSYIKAYQQIEDYELTSGNGIETVETVAKALSDFVVVDVAVLDNGLYKVIEINNPFCSGFYNRNNPVKVFNAIEETMISLYGEDY